MAIKLHVWGDYALFTRPEMKVERVSYDVMTPSAARGILTAIYWKPQIEWVIDRIHVLKPIRFTSVRRNEVKARMNVPMKEAMKGEAVDPLGMVVEDERQQRASLVLRDVEYVIEAHFNLVEENARRDLTEQPMLNLAAKHYDMFKRRAESGQAFHQPYFGCREFPASFEWLEADAPLPPCMLPEEQRNKDFGWVFHDFVYKQDKRGKVIESNQKRKLTLEPRFFHAVAKDGVIRIPSLFGEEVRA